MERFLIILFLIIFRTSYGQDNSEREFDKLNIIVEYEDDEQSQINQSQTENIIDEQLNIELLPDLQRSRRNTEDIQEPSPTPTISNMTNEINKLKRRFDQLQSSQQKPNQKEHDKIFEVENKIENIIDILNLQQQQAGEQRKSLRNEDSVKCDRHSKSNKSKTKEPTLSLIPEIVFTPKSKMPHRKNEDADEKKKKMNKSDIIYLPRKPKSNRRSYKSNKNIKAHALKKIFDESEEVLLKSETRRSKIEEVLGKIQNKIKGSKNIKCIRTSSTLICAGSLN